MAHPNTLPNDQAILAAFKANANDPAAVYKLMQENGVSATTLGRVLNIPTGDVVSYLTSGATASNKYDTGSNSAYYGAGLPSTETKEQFLSSIDPSMLDASGKFKSAQEGGNFMDTGLTPDQVWAIANQKNNQWFNDETNADTGQTIAAHDQMLDPHWQPGVTDSGGFVGNAWRTARPAAIMAAMAMGGEALAGPGDAGAVGATGSTDGNLISGLSNSQVGALNPEAVTPGAAAAAPASTSPYLLGSGASNIGAVDTSVGSVIPAATGSTGATLAAPGTMGSGTFALDSSIPALGATPVAAAAGTPGTAGTALFGTAGGATTAAGNVIGDGTAAAGTAAGAGATTGGAMDSVSQWISDNPMMAKALGLVVGGAVGAAAGQGGQTTATQNKDPWAPAQPYLLNNLQTNANMQANYLANPFSDTQKQQYQGLLNTLANNQAVGNGLLNNSGAFMNSKHGVMPAMQAMPTGTQAPTIDWSQYQNMGSKK